MQKIVTHFWYDTQAREAAELYVSTLSNSQIKYVTTLHDNPSGDVDIVTFDLLGREFQAISAGPYFKLNPSISLLVHCHSKEEVDAIWDKLSPGGMTLMELGEYPFSERFVWLQDKYGLSWQILYDAAATRQKITPYLMYTGAVCGKAEEAINFYTSLFPGSQVNRLTRYGPGEDPDRPGTLKQATFSLFGQDFWAMDSAYPHQFGFNEAVSLIVKCDTQDELDHYWAQLSADPEAEQCGWLKDRFGVSWQIVPAAIDEMMSDTDLARQDRVSKVLLQMKKLDIAALEAAYEGR